MTRAQLLIERIRQQKEDTEAIQQYWLSQFPEFGDLSARQVKVWATMYEFDDVVFGLDRALIQLSKRLSAVEKEEPEAAAMTKDDVIRYASGTMKGRKAQREQREEE